jgi:hypothetical protein
MWRRKTEHGCIALFPDEKVDADGYTCSSYEHVGQHGGADYVGVMRRTRPATPAEYDDLAEELSQLGYNLKIVKHR